MRLKRMRDKGLLPPLPKCNVCGKQVADGNSKHNKASQMGLCFDCWLTTPQASRFFRWQRRRGPAGKVWSVVFFGGPSGQDPEPFSQIRKARTASASPKGQPPGPVWTVWSDGGVTVHFFQSASDTYSLTPEAGDPVLDDASWFRNQVDDGERYWLEY